MLAISVLIFYNVLLRGFNSYCEISTTVGKLLRWLHIENIFAEVLLCHAIYLKLVDARVQTSLKYEGTFVLITKYVLLYFLYIIKLATWQSYFNLFLFGPTMGDNVQRFNFRACNLKIRNLTLIAILEEFTNNCISSIMNFAYTLQNFVCLCFHSLPKLVLNVCL